MFGCKCLSWNGIAGGPRPQPEPFSLPAPIPQWPPGGCESLFCFLSRDVMEMNDRLCFSGSVLLLVRGGIVGSLYDIDSEFDFSP